MKGFGILFFALAAFALNGGAAGFECPGVGYYPNPDDCGSYYACAAGSEPVLMACPDGLLYDQKLGICGLPQTVSCAIDPTTEPTTPSTIPTTSSTSAPSTSPPTEQTTVGTGPSCPPHGNHQVENPLDCSTFYYCIEGDYVVLSCPEGYGFDQESNTCRPASEVNCNIPTQAPTTPSPNQPTCPAEGSQLFPNPGDCSSFFVCLGGSSYVITCPVGLEFSVHSQSCENIEDAGCSVPLPTTEEPTTEKPTVTTTSPSTTTGSYPSCDGRPNGAVFPDPTDCSYYYQCNNGVILRNTCPPGLEFNEKLMVCDYPENAHCTVTQLFM